MQPELIFWYEAMRYGVVNLGNYSIHAKDTLFYYQTMDKEQFTPETYLTSRFTVAITYLTPLDPVYHQVTAYVLAEKEKATTAFGNRLRINTHIVQTPPQPH